MKSSANIFPFVHLLKQLADVEQPAEESVAARFYWKDGFLWALEFSGTPILIGPVDVTPPAPYPPIVTLDPMPAYAPDDLLRFSDTSDSGIEKKGTVGSFLALTFTLPPQTGQAGKVLKTDGTVAGWAPDNDTLYTLTGLLPPQTGQAGKVLKTDGTTATWGPDNDSGLSTIPDPLTIGTLTVTTLATMQGGVVFTGGTFATSKLYRDAVAGVVLSGFSGTVSEFALYSGAGLKVFEVPVGTTNIVLSGTFLSGNITSTGTLTIAGLATLQGGVTSPGAGGPTSEKFGANSTSNGAASVAVGNIASANSLGSSALGYNAIANQIYGTAIGANTTIAGASSTAVGYGANSISDGGTSLGYQASSGNYATAVGIAAAAAGNYAVGIGYNSIASGPGSVALGALASAGQTGAIAIGNGVISTINYQTRIGTSQGHVIIGDGPAAGAGIQVSKANPQFFLTDSSTSPDYKHWYWQASGADMYGYVINDALNINAPWIHVSRVGTTVNYVEFPSRVLFLGDVTVGGALMGGSPIITESTTARSLHFNDNGRYIRLTNAASCVITIPPQSSMIWLVNTEIYFRMAGAVAPSIVPGSGVTVNNSAGAAALTQHASFCLKRIDIDVWDFI